MQKARRRKQVSVSDGAKLLVLSALALFGQTMDDATVSTTAQKIEAITQSIAGQHQGDPEFR